MKHRKREPGSEVSSTKSNISRAMRGRVPKVPNFLAMRNQQPTTVTTSHSEHHASSSSTTPAAAAQHTRTSDRTFLLRNRKFSTQLHYSASTKTTPPSGRFGKLSTTTRINRRVSATYSWKSTRRTEYISSHWSCHHAPLGIHH